MTLKLNVRNGNTPCDPQNKHEIPLNLTANVFVTACYHRLSPQLTTHLIIDLLM